MVNCPKCNFTQPKDRFCANCGIDMETYRPRPQPLALRLFKNWIFQLSVFIVAIVIGVGLIRAKNRAQFSERFAALEQAASNRVSDQKNFLSKKPIEKKFSQEVVTSTPSQAASPLAKAESPAPVAESAANVQQPAVQTSIQTSVSKLADAMVGDSGGLIPTKLKLVFAELNRGTFAALLGDSRSIASFGVYFSGLLPDRDDKSKAGLTGINVLDSANDLQIKLNQPIVVFKGSRDPQLEQNIGLTTQITPTYIDDLGAHLQIEVKRSLRSPAGLGAPLIEETFQEQMILKKNSKGFMSGLLPHRILSEEEARILGTNPTILKVLASGDFQSGNSEFILFIEAK